ncbi:MAG TPA: hypothetical protein VFN66_06235 [Burkholderiales bacterium]|nr:hypothetical protein [Burkholderiales bacterium]
MSMKYEAALEVCKRHADRLSWAMGQLQSKFPLTAAGMHELNDTDLAILDQFTTRFAKLQDAMGANLFPAVLELTKEQGNLAAFLDILNRLEKIGAIPSTERWLLLREMRNQFSHDYPDDPVIQSAMLNKAFLLANDLLAALGRIESFAKKYHDVL